MKFYLGTHQVCWLSRLTVPLFVSYGRLRVYKTLPRAICSWRQDSRGFTELSQHGRWTFTAKEYAERTRLHMEGVGGMTGASIMDWMCEPFILSKTGLTVKEHQQRTIDSYLELSALEPGVPWMPVLQGYLPTEYLEHVAMYEDAGVDLTTFPTVGLGSVCRRQHAKEIHDLVWLLSACKLKLHGFGMKIEGLRAVADMLVSADSMAWSYSARRSAPLPNCHHGKDGKGKCTSCARYALIWRQKVAESINSQKQRYLIAA